MAWRSCSSCIRRRLIIQSAGYFQLGRNFAFSYVCVFSTRFMGELVVSICLLLCRKGYYVVGNDGYAAETRGLLCLMSFNFQLARGSFLLSSFMSIFFFRWIGLLKTGSYLRYSFFFFYPIGPPFPVPLPLFFPFLPYINSRRTTQMFFLLHHSPPTILHHFLPAPFPHPYIPTPPHPQLLISGYPKIIASDNWNVSSIKVL